MATVIEAAPPADVGDAPVGVKTIPLHSGGITRRLAGALGAAQTRLELSTKAKYVLSNLNFLIFFSSKSPNLSAVVT